MAKKSQSMILSKINKAAPGAHKTHKDGEGVVRGAGLPDGIERGVAEFQSWKLDEQKSGKHKGTPYVSFTSVVHEPDDCKGLKATKTIFIRKTQSKTAEDKVGEVYNEVKLLGGDTSGCKDLAAVLGLLDDLKGNMHYFHTWKQKPTKEWPNPQVQVQFDGLATNYEASGDNLTESDVTWTDLGISAEEGDEDAQAQLNEAASDLDIDPDEHSWTDLGVAIDEAYVGGEEQEADTEEEESEEEPAEEETEEEEYEDEEEESGIDWATLGEEADGGDAGAVTTIEEAFRAEGGDPDDYSTYAEVAAILAQGDEGSEEEEEEPEAEEEEGEEEGSEGDWEPGIGEVYFYKPPRKDKVEVEVTKVVKSRRVVDVKAYDDNESVYKNVSWDKLEGEDE